MSFMSVPGVLPAKIVVKTLLRGGKSKTGNTKGRKREGYWTRMGTPWISHKSLLGTRAKVMTIGDSGQAAASMGGPHVLAGTPREAFCFFQVASPWGHLSSVPPKRPCAIPDSLASCLHLPIFMVFWQDWITGLHSCQGCWNQSEIYSDRLLHWRKRTGPLLAGTNRVRLIGRTPSSLAITKLCLLAWESASLGVIGVTWDSQQLPFLSTGPSFQPEILWLQYWNFWAFVLLFNCSLWKISNMHKKPEMIVMNLHPHPSAAGTSPVSKDSTVKQILKYFRLRLKKNSPVGGVA
jgi:hypothetical protein